MAGNVYEAYLCVAPPPRPFSIWGGEFEVMYPIGSGNIQFLLADEAGVRIKSRVPGREDHIGQWGNLKRNPDLPVVEREGKVPFIEVEVLMGVWRCDPQKIAHHIDGLKDQISRRNLQVKDLRGQLAAAKQR